MKAIILTVLYTACYATTSAQALSMELSIEWQKPGDGLSIEPNLRNDKTLVPFLKVKYFNHTADSIYFREIIGLEGGMPIVFGEYSAHKTDPDLKKLAQSRARMNYDVHVRQDETTVVQQPWEVLKSDQSRNIATLVGIS